MNPITITSYGAGDFLPDELITKKELANKLKLTMNSVDRLVKKGVIPILRVGSSPRYCWCDVLNSIKNHQFSRQ